MAASNASLYLSPVFEYERAFKPHDWLSWVSDNWTVSLWLSAVYVAFIFSGQSYMSSRPSYDLRMPLFIWSSLLAAFSAAGFVRTAPELWYTLVERGFRDSVCNNIFVVTPPVSYWTYLMALSKALELGDTVFIVMRKRPLIFLHWYHHITVLIYCFYAYSLYNAVARWFVVMNYLVHAIMYAYYALKALRVGVPRGVNMLITSMQLAQMVVGVFVNAMAYHYLNQGNTCTGVYKIIYVALAMYGSYFILFAHFFYTTYIAPKTNST